jgi:hypothetical protein
MIPSLPINDHYQTCFCWLAARRTRARIYLRNSRTAELAITARNQHCTHLDRPAHPPDTPKISLHLCRPHFVSTADVPKSP